MYSNRVLDWERGGNAIARFLPKSINPPLRRDRHEKLGGGAFLRCVNRTTVFHRQIVRRQQFHHDKLRVPTRPVAAVMRGDELVARDAKDPAEVAAGKDVVRPRVCRRMVAELLPRLLGAGLRIGPPVVRRMMVVAV